MIVDMIIEYAFTLFKDRPTFNEFKKTLIERATTDHIWYIVLSEYKFYKDLNFTKTLLASLREFAMNIIEKKLIIEEVLKIKNQETPVREALLKYLKHIKSIRVFPEFNEIDFNDRITALIAETD